MSVEDICQKYKITGYLENQNKLDVYGGVFLWKKCLTELPVQFNKVTGSFNVGHNQLTSLEGCPKYVGKDFVCDNNLLTSLKHGPKYVEGIVYCFGNNLTSLRYMPDCEEIHCSATIAPYEYRYIFYHKIKRIETSDDALNIYLNHLLNSNMTVIEKNQELQKFRT